MCGPIRSRHAFVFWNRETISAVLEICFECMQQEYIPKHEGPDHSGFFDMDDFNSVLQLFHEMDVPGLEFADETEE